MKQKQTWESQKTLDLHIGVAIGLLFSFLMIWLKQSVLYGSLILILVLGNYYSYKYIGALSIFNVFKYLTIFGGLDTYSQLADYTDINLFSIPITRYYLTIFFNLILSIILTLFVYFGYSEKYLKTKTLNLNFRFEKINVMRKFSLHRLNSIETWRMFCSKGGLLILISLTAFSFLSINSEKELYLSRDRAIYLEYFNQVKGSLTQHTLDKMDCHKNELDGVDEKINELNNQFEQGDISANELFAATSNLQNMKTKSYSFNKLYQQINNSSDHLDSKYPVEVIDEKSSRYWFESSKINAVYGAISSIAIIFFSVVVFKDDSENHLLPLLKSTPLGHRKVLFVRLAIQFILSIFVGLILIFSHYQTGFYQGYLTDFNISIHSFVNLTGLGMDCSVGGFVLIFIIYAILSLFLQSMIVTLIFQMIKNIWVVLVIGFFAFTFPNVILFFYPQVQIIKVILPSNAFSIITIVKQLDKNGITAVFVILSILLNLLVVANYYKWRKNDC